ncbi:MAG: YbgF trimerization domain-containing protein [Pseudomonadota bacterium]
MLKLIQQQASIVAPAFDLKRATGAAAALCCLLLTVPLVAQTPQSQSDGMASRMIIELQQMREEMRELRGLVEAQSQEIEDLKRRQRDQYLDLDERISALGASAQAVVTQPIGQPDVQLGRTSVADSQTDTATPEAQSPPPPSDLPEVRMPIDRQAEIITLNAPTAAGVREMQPPTEAEQQAYDQAFLALRETRYADAAEGFDRFLRDHPNSSFAPNAQYWLGEVYYVTRDFETALSQFNR